MDGFFPYQTLSAGSAEQEEILGLASTQYKKGDMLSVTAGIASLVTAAGRGTHAFSGVITPPDKIRPATIDATTAAQESVNATRVEGGQVGLFTELSGNSAPPINGVGCNANASPTTVVVPFAGGVGAGDFANGQVYIPELNEQRLITGSAFGGGIETLTVAPAFSRAPTNTDTCIVVPFSKGAYGVKYNATTPSRGIDTSIAGKTGGTVKIENVFLGGGNSPSGITKSPYAVVSCPDLH